jgi:hypothetical protein
LQHPYRTWVPLRHGHVTESYLTILNHRIITYSRDTLKRNTKWCIPMKPFTARKVGVKYFSALTLIISASLQKLRHFRSYRKWNCSWYTLKMKAGSSL